MSCTPFCVHTCQLAPNQLAQKSRNFISLPAFLPVSPYIDLSISNLRKFQDLHITLEVSQFAHPADQFFRHPTSTSHAAFMSPSATETPPGWMPNTCSQAHLCYMTWNVILCPSQWTLWFAPLLCVLEGLDGPTLSLVHPWLRERERDCTLHPCSTKTREVLGNPSPTPERFPEGNLVLVEYGHSLIINLSTGRGSENPSLWKEGKDWQC